MFEAVLTLTATVEVDENAQVYFSQWNSFLQDTLSDTLSKSPFCYNIYFVTEQILQVHKKSPKVEEAAAWLQIH